MSRKEHTPQNAPGGQRLPEQSGYPGGLRRPLGDANEALSTSVKAREHTENRKILVVGSEPVFSEPVLDYAVSLAERLGYDLIALHVCPGEQAAGLAYSPYRRYLQEKFKRQARAQANVFREKVTAKGIRFEHLVRSGDLAKAVEALNQEKKRIEFVVNASEFSEAEITAGVSLPVFTIKGYQGDSIMADLHLSKKPFLKTGLFGVATAALYAAVFVNTDVIMKYFTLGGWYATLPIATVFLFSYVHGSFSNYLWTALGIEAPKKAVQPQPTAAKRPVRRQRPRPRLTLNV